jgi:hypothetical protein
LKSFIRSVLVLPLIPLLGLCAVGPANASDAGFIVRFVGVGLNRSGGDLPFLVANEGETVRLGGYPQVTVTFAGRSVDLPIVPAEYPTAIPEIPDQDEPRPPQTILPVATRTLPGAQTLMKITLPSLSPGTKVKVTFEHGLSFAFKVPDKSVSPLVLNGDLLSPQAPEARWDCKMSVGAYQEKHPSQKLRVRSLRGFTWSKWTPVRTGLCSAPRPGLYELRTTDGEALGFYFGVAVK